MAHASAARKKAGFWHSFRGYKENWQLVAMLLPFITLLIVFAYIPMGGLAIAFKDFKLNLGIWGSEWVGLANFRKLFSMPSFLEVLRNTFVIYFFRVLFGFPAPILLALMMNEISFPRFKKAAQTVSYLPHFLSWIILSGLFTQILSPSSGFVNGLIQALGGNPIYFLGDPKYFVGTIIVTDIWREVGWGSIIYFAAMSSISPDLYEAAEVDGATRIQKILHITLPSLRSVICIMLIMSLGSTINAGFDQIFNLYNEAVYSVGDIIDTYVYRRGLIGIQYDFGAAAGLFMNLIAFTLVMVSNKVVKLLGGSTLF